MKLLDKIVETVIGKDDKRVEEAVEKLRILCDNHKVTAHGNK